MTSLRSKSAVVLGATSGIGKATVKRLVAEGARVTAVARNTEGLAALHAELAGVHTVAADAAEPATADRLVREARPDVVVLAAGVRPAMGTIDEFSWESFSEAWASDTQAAFHVMQAALSAPLRAGSAVIVVSSGAAINGSHLSGGYAGAKRMQWLLAGYAQTHADKKALGVRFLAVVPKQLVERTKICEIAATTYGAWTGTSAKDYMARFEVPLDADKVAAAICAAAQGDVAAGVTAIGVTGKGFEPL